MSADLSIHCTVPRARVAGLAARNVGMKVVLPLITGHSGCCRCCGRLLCISAVDGVPAGVGRRRGSRGVLRELCVRSGCGSLPAMLAMLMLKYIRRLVYAVTSGERCRENERGTKGWITQAEQRGRGRDRDRDRERERAERDKDIDRKRQ